MAYEFFTGDQIERKREIDDLEGLITHWKACDTADAEFCELLDFARLYRKWLEAKIAPAAIAARIADAQADGRRRLHL